MCRVHIGVVGEYDELCHVSAPQYNGSRGDRGSSIADRSGRQGIHFHYLYYYSL